ncbi:hypothetical protein Q3G72_022654 [Acer saccharum]|nr:hypothetical protein Q3G72_022654 [Acer saccharum]
MMECCSIFDGVVKLVSNMALLGVHTNRGDLRVHESLEVSTDLVDYIDEISEASMKERGVFAVALYGGSLISLMDDLSHLCFLIFFPQSPTPYLSNSQWIRKNTKLFLLEEALKRKLEQEFEEQKPNKKFSTVEFGHTDQDLLQVLVSFGSVLMR